MEINYSKFGCNSSIELLKHLYLFKIHGTKRKTISILKDTDSDASSGKTESSEENSHKRRKI